jgi:carboxymethylenebutenolidase
MPPLIELHGENNRSVPLATGEELVKLARAVGASAKQITYPNKGHGFDFSDTDPMTTDASGGWCGFLGLTWMPREQMVRVMNAR